MKLATAAEMRGLDRMARDRYGIPGLLLMENAGRAIAREVMALLVENGAPDRPLVSIWVGKGNNGGDGLCAARHLLELGTDVRVTLFAEAGAVRGDAAVNLDIARRLGIDVAERPDGPTGADCLALARSDVIVDALLGTGFSGPLRGFVAAAVVAINESRRPVVSVDVPSGLDADTGRGDPAVRATVTVTLGLPKRGLAVPPGLERVGRLIVAPISMPPALLEGAAVRGTWIESGEAAEAFPERSRAAHKGDFGHLLVVAGARGYTGAPVLAAMGAVRTGAGLVTLTVPRGIWPVVGRRLREVMVQPVTAEAERFGPESLDEVLTFAERATAVALGPGLGRDPATTAFVRALLNRLPPAMPMVIDADGLNALAGAPAETLSTLARRGSVTVLTPHPGEMAQLMGTAVEEVQGDRFATATAAAARLGTVVLLKGAGTVIAAPDGSYGVNSTGNPGLASGGTGDVLTGVIGALLAQGRATVLAASAGAYVHGRAADRLAGRRGQAGLAAGDLPPEVPAVIKELRSLTAPPAGEL
ncbi:MAG: NAD(P)H-hydrate dehydratase [Bacillota bacterium]